jgi:hypothetical protein
MDDELLRFKQSDLRQYAASVGFVVDHRESSRGSSVMRREHEKLIISRKSEGVYTWWDVHSEDRGTIVDFVQRENPGLNLGGERKELRAWMGLPTPALPELPALISTSPDLDEVRRRYFGMSVPLNHPYLEDERAIPASTLQHWRFAGQFRIDQYGAAAFPHFDNENEVCGYELKNRGGFTGFAPGGRKGIWLSNTNADDRRLILAESGIDAISHAVLFDDPVARYGSIGGRPTSLQLEIIRKLFVAMPENAKVVAAMDANDPGRELADLIEDVYSSCGRGDLTLCRHEPEGAEDWNDLLKARRKNPSLPASSPQPRVA